MDKHRQYKTERQCGFSKRHLKRIIKKMTEKDCENLLKTIDNEESDDSDCSSIMNNENIDR